MAERETGRTPEPINKIVGVVIDPDEASFEGSADPNRLVWITEGSLLPGTEVDSHGRVYSVDGMDVEPFEGNETGQPWD